MLEDVTLTTEGDRDRIEFAGTVCTVQPNPRWPETVRHRTACKIAHGVPEGQARDEAAREVDAWSYTVPRALDETWGRPGAPQTFTHPTREGARHMCRRWYVDAGLLLVPTDNCHLGERDREIAFRLREARAEMHGPRVGDFVQLPGHVRPTHRICGFSFDGLHFGLSSGGSYSLPTRVERDGAAAGYSGGLDWHEDWRLDRLEDTGATDVFARFWFFSEGIPGAGRGVDVALPARVYRLRGES